MADNLFINAEFFKRNVPHKQVFDTNQVMSAVRLIQKTNLVSTRDSESFWERASEFSNKYKEMDKISKDAYSSGFGPPITWDILYRLDEELAVELKSLVSPYYDYDGDGKLID